MANLTGNKIKSTYAQVANLSGPVSTTFQTLTDGLGNDMGLEFKDDFINVRTGFSFSVNGSSLSTTFAGLSDVTITGAADDDMSVYNGSAWVNETVATVEAKFNHDNLAAFVADEHVAHSGVSVIAASGSGLLAGNDDLSSNIGLAVDISGTTAKATPIGADSLMIYDSVGTANKKSTISQLEAVLDHDALTNFVANEHIDWTSTSSALSTSGIITSTSTAHTHIATGTTAQRAPVAAGDFRYNTTDNKPEAYNGSTWDQLAFSAVSGETNTASNSGASGVGVWARKTGTDLEFKNITVDANMSITDDTGNDEIDIALSVGTLPIADGIQHTGDTNNTITFGTDTQTYTTGGTSRLDMTDSGVRIGTGARVTTILDEDAMGTDSATALATQQSIKAYVDASTTPGSAFAVYNGSLQNVSNATFTKVTLPTEEFDTNSDFDSTTNYRFTPTVAGKYLINGGVSFNGGTDTEQIWVILRRNGSDVAVTLMTGSGTASNGTNVSKVLSFNGSTDYVELWCYQTSGVTNDTIPGSAYVFMTGGRVIE